MSKSHNKPPKDFEEAMAELDRIVADMEEGKTSLEESLVRFERGSFLIEHCRKVLSQAEQKIEVLTRGKDEGAEVRDDPEQND
ncbi:MAG TPA: exodeoxyribonuclease VII small subunit [Tepidisphaeraceae bacterium]|nr:exodeoxyribonuclease VII small subunit [Tepidisphaeraceae bacterium]